MKKNPGPPARRRPAAELIGPFLALFLLALAGGAKLREPPRKRAAPELPPACREPENLPDKAISREQEKSGPAAGERKKTLNSCPENLRFILGMPMNLNRVSEKDLELIPGIGPGKAALIIKKRRLLGRFASLEELENLPGLSSRDLQLLRAAARVEDPHPRP